jgi:iron complex transport system substrate-binding protein
MDDLLRFPLGPQRIVCLTERAAEWRRRLGREHRTAGMLGGSQAMLNAVAARWAAGANRAKVFFEEWDTPHISAIRWVSELNGIAGGDDYLLELAVPSLSKKFQPETLAARKGWADVPAIQNGQPFEIRSPDILQSGAVALTDGITRMRKPVPPGMAIDLAGAFAR